MIDGCPRPFIQTQTALQSFALKLLFWFFFYLLFVSSQLINVKSSWKEKTADNSVEL